MFIRRATEKDIAGMLECLYQFSHDELEEHELMHTFAVREAKGWMQYVCVYNDTIVGTFACLIERKLYKKRGVLHIEDVATHPNYHCMGIGTSMMRFLVENIIKPSDVYKGILHCDIDKAPFYEHNGFIQSTTGMRFNNV